jgi:LysR family transcriptional regulator, hydrogen peroxide-inducible genes activator
MQLAQIKYFLAACETTNFTHAAKACNVTQPALTRSIRMLEEELGGALFLREHHLTQLTPFGKLMRAHFEQILADTERLREVARQYKARNTAAFSLGTMPAIGPNNFKDLLKQFGTANKGVQLNLFEGDRERLQELLLDSTLHLAFMVEAETDDERFRGIRLYGERYQVAFPHGHRFQEMTSIRLGDLAKERHVMRPGCAAATQLRQVCRDRDFELEPELTSESESWSQVMVAAGLGIMFVPETTSLAAGLSTRPIADLRLERDIHLVSVAGRYIAPAIARFIRAAQNHVWARSTSAA